MSGTAMNIGFSCCAAVILGVSAVKVGAVIVGAVIVGAVIVGAEL